MRESTIVVNYPGSVISVNHYLGKRKDGGYYVKPGARNFKEELGWLVKVLHIYHWRLPLSVTCSGCFRHWGVAPDLSNLSKVILDTIQEVTGINDKHFRWHDGERLVGYSEPYLLITIKEGEDADNAS